MSYFDHAITIYDRFIDCAQLIKNYIMPQYRLAAKELYKIINNLLVANQTIVKWINNFIILDISNNKKDFLKFSNEYEEFKAGPDFDKIRLHCHEIDAVYTSHLDGFFRQIFSNDNKKYNTTKEIFELLRRGDFTTEQFVNYIFNKMDTALYDIKNNYQEGKQIQENFTNEIEKIKINLEKQISILRDLRQDFLNLSGTVVSI